ncbi:MAG TPA: hypothetical protein VFO05_10670 [Candidatus Limnocylindrales bacterium]|nr:hypothetical protein [Candidatus Limnocylindrales bacterium]
MHELARRAQAMILIRMASERIRSEYLAGSLDDDTARAVDEALSTLDRLGDGIDDYVNGVLRRSAINVVAARAAGGDRAAELETTYAAAYLAAKQLRHAADAALPDPSPAD